MANSSIIQEIYWCQCKCINTVTLHKCQSLPTVCLRSFRNRLSERSASKCKMSQPLAKMESQYFLIDYCFLSFKTFKLISVLGSKSSSGWALPKTHCMEYKRVDKHYLHVVHKREIIAWPNQKCSVRILTYISFRCPLLVWCIAWKQFFRRIIRSWVTVWLLCGVDSGSWQQALLNMNDFLCCRPGLWYLSALHPSLLCHSLHLSPTVSLQPTSPPSTHALPPLSPSLCPLAHFPQWLGPESHDVSLDLQVNPSPKASWVPSHLPLFPSPFLWLSLGTATSSCGSLWSPWSPTGPNSGYPW